MTPPGWRTAQIKTLEIVLNACNNLLKKASAYPAHHAGINPAAIVCLTMNARQRTTYNYAKGAWLKYRLKRSDCQKNIEGHMPGITGILI